MKQQLYTMKKSDTKRKKPPKGRRCYLRQKEQGGVSVVQAAKFCPHHPGDRDGECVGTGCLPVLRENSGLSEISQQSKPLLLCLPCLPEFWLLAGVCRRAHLPLLNKCIHQPQKVGLQKCPFASARVVLVLPWASLILHLLPQTSEPRTTLPAL